MTQEELDREVAHATGESVGTIAGLGFVPLTRVPVEHEPDRKPLVVDWDALDRERYTPSVA